MRIRSVLLGAIAACALSGCDDGTAPLVPTTTNLQAARAAWVARQPTDYSFEVNLGTEWGGVGAYSEQPDENFYRVTVTGGIVTSFRDRFGRPVQGTAATIEEAWQRILAADQDGSLTKATFTVTGVPVDWLIDDVNWADDAVHYWVRDFRLAH
jgi:hypothetical protein